MVPNSDGATIAASVAMIASVTRSSMSVKPRDGCGRRGWRGRSALYGTRHLLHRCPSHSHFLPAIGKERHEAAALGERAEPGARRAFGDRVAQGVGDDDQLEQTDAPAVAGATTGWTSDAAREANAAGGLPRD